MSQVSIYIPPDSDDLRSNINKLRLLTLELRELKDSFHERVNYVKARETELLKHAGVPKPVFSANLLSDDFADVQLNLFAKCYFFVLKQYADRLLHTCYLLRGPLGYDKVRNSLCDASLSGKLTAFMEKLHACDIDYDPDLLAELRACNDLLIVTRITRNSIKTLATVRVLLVNNEEARIIVPIVYGDEKQRRNYAKLLSLLDTNLSATGENLKNFIFPTMFMDQAFDIAKHSTDVITEKVRAVAPEQVPTMPHA